MKKTFGKIKKIFFKSNNILTLSWLILLFIIIISFVSFIFADILITTKNSINLLQTFYNGHPLDFYSINYGLVIDKFSLGPTVAYYELPIYVIFAVWNLPLWIAQSIFHISITESMLCLIWLKSILVVFLGFCVWVIKKICFEINIDIKHIPWVIFAFVSSPLLIMPLFIMGQYDIIELFFILIGILMYIKGKFKWFLVCFAIAIPIKIFALFIFIPLILLKHKKVLQIIKYVFIGLIPMLLTVLVSSQMPMYKETKSLIDSGNNGMLSFIFASGINVNFGNASLFCIAFVAIAIFCYTKIIKNKDELNKFSIYIPLLVLSCFFLFVRFHPQWLILITPFIALTLFQNMKNHKINIILDIVSSSVMLIITLFVYYFCYDSLVIERMALPKLFGSTYGMTLQFPYIMDILNKFGIQNYLPFFLATYVTCTSAFLIINFPRKTTEKEDTPNIEWGMLIFRMLVIVPIPILMIFCYYHIA